MARGMHGTETAIYRAVITHVTAAQPDAEHEEDRPERAFVEYAGPYTATNPAKAAISLAERSAKHYNERRLRYRFPGPERSASGHVERAELKWEAV